MKFLLVACIFIAFCHNLGRSFFLGECILSASRYPKYPGRVSIPSKCHSGVFHWEPQNTNLHVVSESKDVLLCIECYVPYNKTICKRIDDVQNGIDFKRDSNVQFYVFRYNVTPVKG